jgi:hypothetical protein
MWLAQRKIPAVQLQHHTRAVMLRAGAVDILQVVSMVVVSTATGKLFVLTKSAANQLRFFFLLMRMDLVMGL